jgi:hypothetical protein
MDLSVLRKLEGFADHMESEFPDFYAIYRGQVEELLRDLNVLNARASKLEKDPDKDKELRLMCDAEKLKIKMDKVCAPLVAKFHKHMNGGS